MHNKHGVLRHRRNKLFIVLLVLSLVFIASLETTAPTNAQDGGQTHVVQSGENLFRIALRYGLTVNELAAANGIVDPTRIFAGQVLVIPTLTAAPSADNAQPATAVAVDANPVSTTATYHIVARGETLGTIAQTYGVGWQEIAAWNNIIDANQIFAGQRLLVQTTNNATVPQSNAVAGPTIQEATPVTASPTTAVGTNYTVQAGDTLASIARQYGISWTTIARANNITNPNSIYSGQALVIPPYDDPTGTYLEPTGGVPAAAAPTITTGKQIVVNLTDQQVYAYEDGVLLRSVTVSTGLYGTPTVTGDFRIYWKLTSQTMSGPGYYLPGVPWVMYFHQGYALHGTYWHNNFGQPMSHGCVNLPTDEAEWFFRWAEVGTPVSVRY